MLREKFFLLFVIFMLPFYTWFNYLMAFLLFIYMMLDRYVNYVIALPDYISCNVENDDETDVQFVLHPKEEYNHALNSKYCLLRNNKVVKYYYKGVKNVIYPVDKLYKKSEKIYLPYVVNKLDAFLWMVYCCIFNFVRNLPPIKKLINKVTSIVIGFIARRAIQMMTRVKKGQLSNKNKKNVTNTLDKIADGKEVDENKLREIIDLLCQKLSKVDKST